MAGKADPRHELSWTEALAIGAFVLTPFALGASAQAFFAAASPVFASTPASFNFIPDAHTVVGVAVALLASLVASVLAGFALRGE